MVSPIKTFSTRKEAETVFEAMRGWAGQVTQQDVPLDSSKYVIECHIGNSVSLYLRENGYVN